MSDSQPKKGELALDTCIERLISGSDWRDGLDAAAADRHHVEAMMFVAEALSEVSQTSASTELARQRTWRRFDVQRRPGVSQRVRRALSEFDVASPVFRAMSATSFASSFGVLTAAAAGVRFA